MLLFLPLAVAWLVLGRRLALAVALTLAAAAVITPWTLRNLRVHERFILIASEGGVTFWTGNHPLARGEGDLAANPELKRAELAFRQSHPGCLARRARADLLPRGHRLDHQSPGRLDAARRAQGVLQRGSDRPLVCGTLRQIPCGVGRAVSARPAVRRSPARGGCGRAHAGRCRCSLLAASSILVGLVFFPQERFRMPVIDPVLIVSAAALAGSSSSRPQS